MRIYSCEVIWRVLFYNSEHFWGPTICWDVRSRNRPVPSSWGSTSQENEATSSDVSWKYGLTKMPMEAKVIFCKWHRKFQAVVGGGNLSFKFHHLTKYHNRKTYLYLFVFPHHSTYLINVPVFLSGPPRKKGPEIWENPHFFFFFF